MPEEKIIAKINVKDKGFSSEPIFSNLKLSVKQGEIVSIYGPSGCGKTTVQKRLSYHAMLIFSESFQYS